MDQFGAMRIFRQVVDAGGFSAAAQVLDMSHSAVSRQVRQLEEALGAQLLNRTTRRFALTEVGQDYYRRCVQILEQVEEAAQMVHQHQSRPSGLLRVNAPMVFGIMEAGKWLPEFMRRHPELKVDLVCNDRFVDLIAEEFDVGLRITRTLPDSTLVARRLCASEMVLVAAPDYLKRHGAPRTPQELAGHNYMAYSLALQTTELSFTGPDGALSNVAVSGRLQSNTGMVVCDAVRAGMGVTASATFVVADDLRSGKLVRLLPDYTLQPRELYALYPQNRHMSPKVRAFVDFVADYYARPRWDF